MATVRLQLSHYARKDGTRSIEIRVTHYRQTRTYSLGMQVSPEDWHKMRNGTPRGKLARIRKKMHDREHHAREICEVLEPFTWREFKRHFSNTGSPETLHYWYNVKIDTIEKESTKEYHEAAMKSLLKFWSKEIAIRDITPYKIDKYVQWMQDNGRSKTTTAMYLRSLRHIFNVAGNYNPLKGYKIPKPATTKRALTPEQIELVLKYEPTGMPHTIRARNYALDIWKLIYYIDGINLKDLIQVKHSDIEGNVLYFNRDKIDGDTEPTVIPEPAIEILKKYRCGDSEYLFVHEYSEYELKLFRGKINKQLKQIGADLELPIKLTTYVARHSFATQMMRSGAPIALISKLLRHKNITTTQVYLGSFPEDEIKRWKDKAL